MREIIIVYQGKNRRRENDRRLGLELDYLLLGCNMEVVRVGAMDELKHEAAKSEANAIMVDTGSLSEGETEQLIKSVRAFSEKPILAVDAESSEGKTLLGLASGADDYCTGECSVLVLIARLQTQVRSYKKLAGQKNPEKHLTLKGLEVDDVSKMVRVEGNRVDLTPTEYKILYLLLKQKGRVLSNKQIYERIWHMEPIGADNTIAVHIRHIREKIEKNPQEPKYLQVVWGQGYKVG